MTDLHGFKLKDEALKFLYLLSSVPPVRDYKLSFYFDATTVQPYENRANNNVDLSVRWSL